MLDLYDEFQHIINVFNSENIPYALCGGMAMAVHTTPRATIDIDLVVLKKDLTTITQALLKIDFDVRSQDMVFDQGNVTISRISKVDKTDGDILSLDLLTLSGALEDIWQKERIEVIWENGALWVLSPEGLIELKKVRNSPQDQVDIQNLLNTQKEKP